MGYITGRELKDASVDAGTLEKFSLGSVGEPNINRAGNDVLNLATINDRVMRLGAAQPYSTLVDLQGDTTLQEGDWAVVLDDPDVENNGYYQMKSGGLKKVIMQPVGVADVDRLQGSIDDLSSNKVDGIRSPVPGVLVSVVDEDGRETFLSARDTDGAPSEFATQLIGLVLGLLFKSAPGYLLALTDSEGRMTDLAIRSSDGQLADFALHRIANRIARYLGIYNGTPSVYPHVLGGDRKITAGDTYQRNGEILPVLTDMSMFAGWGSSSMQRSAPYFSELAAELGASYYNGGVGGHRTEQIAARLGSVPALCTFPEDTIPAGTEEISINVPDISWHAGQDYLGTVNGIHGRLRYSGGPKFSRSDAGEPVHVEPGTPFIPDEGARNRAALTFLWMGRNDLSTTDDRTDDCIRNTDASYDFLAPLVKRVLVLGHFKGGQAPGSRAWQRIDKVNNAHRVRYGLRFADINEYLISPKVWLDMGITPTEADLEQQSLGVTPESLRADDLHLTPAAYRAVVKFYIRARLMLLGWSDI